MKNKILYLSLIAIFITGCTSPKYLPTSDKLNVGTFGSYIDISRKKESNIEGELISIDSSKIIVLNVITRKCEVIQINTVTSFELMYAQPKHYGWTIPLYTLSTISHGLWLVLTAPANLIVTIAVTVGGEEAFTYNEKNMTYEKLKMFARFPQGVPTWIELTSIK